MTTKAQQIKLDNAHVALENHQVIGKCNMRINPGMKPKEPTYQVALDALSFTTCYPAFLIIVEVPIIYMHQDILNICLRIQGKEFYEPPTEEEVYLLSVNLVILKRSIQILWGMYYKKNLDFVALIWEDLAYQIDNIDSKKQDKMFNPRFTKKIIHHFLEKDKSISMRNRMFMHTSRDDSLLGRMRFVSRHANTQVYGEILPQAMTNQALLDSLAYKTYYENASGAEPPILRKSQKKSDSAISSEESPSKKKSAKAKKVVAPKPKPTKKKTLFKADRGKSLNVLSEYILGVPNVPKYDSKNKKEYWGDSGEEDEDDENDSEDKSNDGDNDDDGNDSYDDDDVNDDDNQESDDTNDDDKETDCDKTEPDRIKIPILNQSTTEYYKEEEEKIDDEETMDDEEDNEVTKELYKDVNVNLGNEDTEITDADQGASEQQNISQESGFEQVEEDAQLLNLENHSPADNEIASLMETLAHHATAVLEITSVFTITIPQLPLFFNPLPQQATPTSTPITSEATTSFPSLPDFSSVFKFNDRVTNMEKDLSKIKQVDQFAQALSFIPAIVDRCIDNKLGEAINKAIQAHNLDCRQEAQDEKNEYIELVDTSMRTIIKEENVAESLEAAVLKRSSSQPQSTYKVAAALSEFELTKMLIDNMEKNKSYDKAAYKWELYEALVKSYETDKDLFDSYGEVFTLKRSKDDKDKDQDPSAGSDRGTKRRKSSKEAESSRDSRSKEKKSSGTSKDASQSQHKPLGKSTHIEEPSHTVEDSGMQQDQDQVAHAKEPRTSFDELMDTSFDFIAFVLNWLNNKDLNQEILVGLAFELLKGTCKSLTELEYHLEEFSKATTERLDWHNLEGNPYPFDLSKPLPLIQDH
ncbi:hypothetical protein Tco_0530703 [Tanacetum coccineum]